MTQKDSLGDRMKELEDREMGRRLMPMLPSVARLDGRSFHRFCRDLARPYDERLSRAMTALTEWLAQRYNANCAYTQSDEISLGWYDYSEDRYGEPLFDGRVLKLCSALAADASVKFNKMLPQYLPEKTEHSPTFDCRIWNTPNLTESANSFLWRELDAARNSIQMAARAVFSHNACMNKSTSELQEMLFIEKGINWNDYPGFFKRGTFITRRRLQIPFSAEEIENLPPLHQARTDPDFTVERWVYHTWADLPRFSTIKNRERFLFAGEEPEFDED